MASLSIFDIFKIGIGPSSSHTLGPWKAAVHFANYLAEQRIDEIYVHLFGSLSKTGKGHATDVAVMLGLQAYDPKTINTQDIASILEQIHNTCEIHLRSNKILFVPERHIVFENDTHKKHPNTLIFKAYLKGRMLHEMLFTSVGGGFIESDCLTATGSRHITLPYPIKCGADIIGYTDKKLCAISDIVLENEQALRPKKKVFHQIDEITETMFQSVYEGCISEGVLPGGLNVRRRAKAICAQLLQAKVFLSRQEWIDSIKKTAKNFNTINNWVSCFALAVNEQNASMNRIVTSPTNGAAGVIPATLLYYSLFHGVENVAEDVAIRFLCTAGEIGCLFKKGATISAAVGGCQAEIGVSSAMAAAGLTEVLGGSPRQCLMAAEIAMEHHLGLTCDPVGGLVQIPCIERNAMGAAKAITSANLALVSDERTSIVKLDMVIKTMWDTAQDMHHKYKETAEGGLAFNLSVAHANC